MGDKVEVIGTKTNNSSSKSKISSILTIFRHADGKDIWLMILGSIGAIGDGLSMPILFYVNGMVFNNFGGSSSTNSQDLVSKTNQTAFYLLYVACGTLVASFMEGYCWTRTGERQATKMRARYLKAVLRQDVGYFDLQVASTSQVVISVSNDTLVIQDYLSEKLPNFIMNAVTFIGCYVIAFVLMWRLALVALPFMVLVLVPGFMCGWALMGVARKVREEYGKASCIVEQAVSSIRTVYSFVGESRIMEEFSAALQGCLRLGLKQGLVKGLTIGSESVIISIWSIIFWFGSNLVMYHGGRGGTIFTVGTCIVMGGISKMGAEMGDKVEAIGTKTNKSSSKSKISSILTIFRHADGKDIWLMVLGFIGAVGDGCSMPALFYVNGLIFNNFGGFNSSSSYSQDLVSKTNQTALYLLYVAFGSLIASFMEGYCWTRTGERQATSMRTRYLKAVLRQDIGYFDLQVSSTSQVVTSVSSDTLVIQDFLSEKLPNFIMNATTFVGCYVVAFVLMWRLALVALPFIVLVIAPGLICGRVLMGLARKVREEYGKAGSIVERSVSSIRMIYSFVGESRVLEEFSAALQGCVKLGLKQGLMKGLAIGSNSIVSSIWSIMFWYGSKLVMYHGGRGGTIFTVGACITIGGISLGTGFVNLKYLSEACAAGERIMQIVKRVPKIDSNNTEGDILQRTIGEVEFKNIQFAYPSRPENAILRDFSLKVPAGRTVALVGGSGSGKSTIISLLQRFYDPLGGEILLDGVNIVKLQLKWLRSQMGLVSQEPALFTTSIKENILFGKEDATMDEVVAAAKSANAHSFISELPQGYDTQVGEGGTQLSGGQKQRIAIARAVIRAPKILLLDEATSALDSESERIVQEALDKAVVGRTTIVIAHRLSTIHNAEIINVVQNGHIMESGSHEELIQNENGLYTSLVRHQQQQQTEEKTKEEESPSISPSSFPLSKHDNNIVTKKKLYSESRSNSENSTAASSQISKGGEANGEQELPVPSFRRLLLLNLPEWKQAIMGCVSAVLVGSVQPVFSFMMGSMISVYFLPSHDEIKSKTKIYSFLFLGLTLFSFVVNLCEHYYFAVMGESLTRRIRERMLSKILTFEIGWFDQDSNSTGAVCSRLAKDANMVRSLVGDRMALLIQTISAVIIACTIGTIIAWRLALVVIATQPLFIICNYFRLVILKKMSNKAIRAQEESSKLAADATSNIRTVTVFSSQDRVLDLLAKTQEGPRRDNIRQAWLAGIVLGTCQGLMYCTRALEFWYGGKLISQGYITAKAFLEAFFTLIITGRIIVDASTMTADLAKGAEAVRSVFAILDRNTRIEPDDQKGYRPERLIGHVELRDVHFSYPARPNVIVFGGFSLRIKARKSTALVGQSGSGKSTIIGLIERFYDSSKGTVEIDGRDIKEYHLRSLRKHIGLVSQEPTLFAGTIRENIAYGAVDGCKVDEVEIVEAARAANAHDFIAGLKDGYDTWCGDKGVQLSGGQKQRIAIARAILKNPAVLLLDEATSALDSASEKVVQEALDRVMVGRTSVIVAHRLSTIKNSNEIVVLEGGKVVEKGTHSTLLALGPTGSYYSLVKLQNTSNTEEHLC